MEYRNPTYNQYGTIDVEINHPLFGWIPFTASPDDPEKNGKQIFAELSKGKIGRYEPLPPQPEESPEKSDVALLREELANLRSELQQIQSGLQQKGIVVIKGSGL